MKIKIYKIKWRNLENENLNLQKKNNNLINKYLENENINLQANNNILKINNINLENDIKSLKNILNVYLNKINNLENKIKLLNIENDKYKSYNKNQNQGAEYKQGDNIIGINFVSMGNQDIINYNIPCKNTELFVKLEEKLYEDFPKYKDYETYFEVNTRRIKRFKTLKENNIKHNDIISVFTVDI